MKRETFNELLKDKARLKSLILNGNFGNPDFEKWKTHRSFISKAIERDGAIFDIGCGNGFFLRCLQEWSGRQLDPYGIDMQERLIEEARGLFPLQASHFKVKDVQADPELSEPGFPASFDFVYWNVWDNFHFIDPREIKILKNAAGLLAPKGRLILGFYESTKDKSRKIRAVEKLGFKLSGVLKNPGGRPANRETIVWIDKK